MKRVRVLVAMMASGLPLSMEAQGPPAAACPVSVVWFDPGGVSERVENVSGKVIVGMSYYAGGCYRALEGDALEL